MKKYGIIVADKVTVSLHECMGSKKGPKSFFFCGRKQNLLSSKSLQILRNDFKKIYYCSDSKDNDKANLININKSCH